MHLPETRSLLRLEYEQHDCAIGWLCMDSPLIFSFRFTLFKSNLNRGLNSASACLQVEGCTLKSYQSTIALLTGEER